MRKIFFCALCALALVACKKTREEGGELLPKVVTGEVIDVTPYSVTITGSARTNSFMDEIQKGVLVSYFPDFTVESSAYMIWSYDDSYDFTITFTGLEPGTTYYYRSYLYYDTTILGHDKHYYGEIKSFTTPSNTFSVTLGKPEIGVTQVVLYGSLHIEYEKEDFKTIPYFVLGKTQSDVESNSGERLYADIMENRGFYYHKYLSETGKYYYKAIVEVDGVEYSSEISSFTTVSFAPTGGDMVDMGLSVKWGSCNVGATYPEGHGDYFAWGETAPKENYSAENYSYSRGSSKVLPLADDAAYVNLGEGWRMPTSQEFEELSWRSLHEWGTYRDVLGYMFISRNNGNSIFFPASGRKDGTENSTLGKHGNYWNSSCMPSIDDDFAGHMYFMYPGSCGVFDFGGTPYLGYSVRGVYVN